MSPLLLLLLLAAAAASAKTMPPPSIAAAPAAAPAPPDAGGCGPSAPPPTPTPWPEQFHASLITNLTARGGRLQQIDIYYDWPRGRALDIIRDQLSGAGEPPLRNVQWVNGTSFLFDAASCRAFHFPVGLLPPDWKARNGTYLGRERADGFDCHVWSNFVFARYDEDVVTGRPVAWNSNGMQRHVLSFEAGAVLHDSSEWQAPAYCFNGTSADAPASH